MAPEQRYVGLTPLWDDTSGTSFDVPGSAGRDRPTSTLDTKVCMKKKENVNQGNSPYSKVHEVQQQTATTAAHAEADLTPPETAPAMKIFKKIPSRLEHKAQLSSPTFDHIRRLRANAKDQILSNMGNDIDDITRNKGKAEECDKSPTKAACDLERSNTPEFILDLEISDLDWAQSLYDITMPGKFRSSEAEIDHSETLQRCRKRGRNEIDPIDALSHAMEELSVFQKISSLMPDIRRPTAKNLTVPLVHVGEKVDAAHCGGDAETPTVGGKSLGSLSNLCPPRSRSSRSEIHCQMISRWWMYQRLQRVSKMAGGGSGIRGFVDDISSPLVCWNVSIKYIMLRYATVTVLFSEFAI